MPSSPLLHVVPADSPHIARSFLNPAPDSAIGAVRELFGYVTIQVHGDTVAAVEAFTDSIFLFHISGRPLITIPMGVAPLRRPAQRPAASRGGDATLRAWISTFDRVLAFVWLPCGQFVVQVSYLTRMGPRYTTSTLVRSGKLVWSFERSPKLLGALGDTVLFAHPRADAPNRLCLAVLEGGDAT